MKLSLKVQMDSPFAMTPSPCSSGTSWSSKTPGSDLENRRSLDTVSDYGLMKLSLKVQMDSPFPLISSPDPSGTSMSSKTPGSNLEDRRRLDTVSH